MNLVGSDLTSDSKNGTMALAGDFYKMADEPKRAKESFESFKDSFSYGSRNDLFFKFIAGFTEDEAAQFLQDLLWKLGESFDDGDFSRIVDHAFEGQVRAYAGPSKWTYDEGPFTPLRKPISESRLVLIAAGGAFIEGEDPEPFGVKNMTQEEAADRIGEFIKSAPDLWLIPKDTPTEKLRVRHGGYDVRGANLDPNVVIPLDPLRELEAEGVIGELVPDVLGFIGACAQTRLLKQSGPEWTEMLKSQQVDAVLLVPT